MRYSDLLNDDFTKDQATKRIKDNLKNPPNKIEGSIASDNAQAVGVVIGEYYERLKFLYKMAFLDTAVGDFLDKKALEVGNGGVERKPATKAKGKVIFTGKNTTVIPVGFKIRSDSMIFVTTSSETIFNNKAIVDIECIEAGIKGNVPEQAINTLVDKLQGIESVTNEQATTGGAEIEDDESLRERAFLKTRFPGTSGNIYHYMHWALDVNGVGRAKVFPLWNGPGTVKVSILNREHRKADSKLIEEVKEYIDPKEYQQKGQELAPIGALLTVSTATEKTVDISLNLAVFEDYEIQDTLNAIKVEVDNYFRDISYKVVEENFRKYVNIASYNMIINIIWNVEGVKHFNDLTLNGKKENIEIGDEEILVVGNIEHKEL